MDSLDDCYYWVFQSISAGVPRFTKALSSLFVMQFHRTVMRTIFDDKVEFMRRIYTATTAQSR